MNATPVAGNAPRQLSHIRARPASRPYQLTLVGGGMMDPEPMKKYIAKICRITADCAEVEIEAETLGDARVMAEHMAKVISVLSVCSVNFKTPSRMCSGTNRD
jgi:hypothetical protein